MKTCTRCGVSKPTSDFHKNASRRDGLQSHCKACERVSSAAYRAANPGKERERINKWEAANQEKVNASKSAWNVANREKINAASAAWRAANKDKVKADWAAWAAANYEARRINSQNRRALMRAVGGKLSKGLADRLLKLQRGKCACGCKKPLGDDFHLDHIMPLALGGSNIDDNIQLLRSTCNQQKYAKHPIDFMQQRGFLL